MSKLAMSMRCAMIIAALSFALAFAQDESTESAPAETPAAENVSEDAAAVAPVAESSEGSPSEAPVAAVEEEEEEEEEEAVAAPSFMTPEPAEPAPEAELAEAAPIEKLPEGKPEKPAKVKKEKAPKEPKPPKEPKEPRDGPMFGIGGRAGVGTSGFQGIQPVEVFPGKAVRMDPLFSFSAGGTFSYYLDDLVTLALEGQYTLYSSRGEVMAKFKDVHYATLQKAVAYVHAVEVPVIARFHLEEAHDFFDFGVATLYVDAGFHLGANVRVSTEIYEGTAVPKMTRPNDRNKFAFGPVAGLGFDMAGLLVGARFSMNVLEYSDEVGGRPWAVHFTVAKNLIEF